METEITGTEVTTTEHGVYLKRFRTVKKDATDTTTSPNTLTTTTKTTYKYTEDNIDDNSETEPSPTTIGKVNNNDYLVEFKDILYPEQPHTKHNVVDSNNLTTWTMNEEENNTFTITRFNDTTKEIPTTNKTTMTTTKLEVVPTSTTTVSSDEDGSEGENEEVRQYYKWGQTIDMAAIDSKLRRRMLRTTKSHSQKRKTKKKINLITNGTKVKRKHAKTRKPQQIDAEEHKKRDIHMLPRNEETTRVPEQNQKDSTHIECGEKECLNNANEFVTSARNNLATEVIPKMKESKHDDLGIRSCV